VVGSLGQIDFRGRGTFGPASVGLRVPEVRAIYEAYRERVTVSAPPDDDSTLRWCSRKYGTARRQKMRSHGRVKRSAMYTGVEPTGKSVVASDRTGR